MATRIITITHSLGTDTVYVEDDAIVIADYVEDRYPGAAFALVEELDLAKSRRIAVLTVSCAAAIVGGYQSSALGEEHTYPSGVTDQINMMGSVTASLLPGLASDWATPFWCEDAAGVWAYRLHSAEQIQLAGADGKAHVVTCQSTLAGLSERVMTAATLADLDDIQWQSV